MTSIARIAIRASIALILIAVGGGYPLPTVAAEVTVRILDSLDPAHVTVTPGTTVTWVNESVDRHRVRSTSGPAEFDSGDLDTGERFSVTLSALGTYEYRDDRNPDNSAFWGTIVVAVAPTATPSPGATTPPVTPPTTGDVNMAGSAFTPAIITIAQGGTVTWRNNDDRPHTVTATAGQFDSGTLSVGQTYQRAFPTAGTFSYLCVFHSNMTGTVVVVAPGSTPAPPPPSTPVPSAASTPPPASPPGSPPARGTVRAIDNAFQPASLTVQVGSRVTFVNAGAAPHTMTARDGSFDSGIVGAGGSWTRIFSTPGTFPFLCALHPNMTGTLVVTDSTGHAPPAASAPPATSGPSATPSGGGDAAGLDPVTFTIRDFLFVPANFRVNVGTTIRWVNADAAPHTVTDEAGSFDSGTISQGGSWSHTFDRTGTYAFVCTFHPAMTGTIVVAAADSHATATVAPATSPPPPVTREGIPILVWATALLAVAAAVQFVRGVAVPALRR